MIKKLLSEIKDTLVPEDPNDSKGKVLGKKIGWVMFLMLMSCGLLATTIAISFAH